MTVALESTSWDPRLKRLKTSAINYSKLKNRCVSCRSIDSMNMKPTWIHFPIIAGCISFHFHIKSFIFPFSEDYWHQCKLPSQTPNLVSMVTQMLDPKILSLIWLVVWLCHVSQCSHFQWNSKQPKNSWKLDNYSLFIFVFFMRTWWFKYLYLFYLMMFHLSSFIPLVPEVEIYEFIYSECVWRVTFYHPALITFVCGVVP